jgi:hypothetical protein
VDWSPEFADIAGIALDATHDGASQPAARPRFAFGTTMRRLSEDWPNTRSRVGCSRSPVAE